MKLASYNTHDERVVSVPKYCIGLTGGIGSGKSTVADIFRQLGALVIDTDVIAHQITQAQGLAIERIRTSFGDEFIQADQSLDRNRMRALVFADYNAKRQLEQILHPLIMELAAEQLKQPSSSPYVVMVVPLLFESGSFLPLIKRVLVVDCKEQQQIERVHLRNGLAEKEILGIMASQIGRDERIKGADDVIYNQGCLGELSAQVSALHLRYLDLASKYADTKR